MPLKIAKECGYFVENKKGEKFSKKPLTKKMAKKQRVAIALSESKKTGKPASYFFLP